MKKIAVILTPLLTTTALMSAPVFADDTLNITQEITASMCSVATDSLTHQREAMSYNDFVSAASISDSLELTLENCAAGETPLVTVSTLATSSSALSMAVGSAEGTYADPSSEPVALIGSTADAGGSSTATLYYQITPQAGITHANAVEDHTFTLTLAHSYN